MADDEIKILSTPKDFDPPPVAEPEPETMSAFDQVRYGLSQ